MAQTFSCPACGAPLDYPAEHTPAVRCPYCDSTVVIPRPAERDDLRVEHSQPESPISANLMGDQLETITSIAQRLQAGKKIEAIKLYRDAFGVGLKEAKEAVEAMARGEPVTVISRQASSSRPVTTKKRGGRSPWGCWLVLLIMALVIPGLFFFTPLRNSLNLVADRAGMTAIGEALPLPSAYASVALAFGSEGIGPGKFTDARHVAVDGQGNIYVAEWEEGSRIQRFSPDGTFMAQFTPAVSDGIVTGLAVDRSGKVYLLQSGNIYIFDGALGEQLGQVEYRENDGFEAMATTVENGLLAWWRGGPDEEIVQFSAQGRVVSSITNPIGGQTGGPELDPHLAVDGLNNIHVLGTFASAVFKFGPDGKFINRFGSRGDEPGQFRASNNIAVDGKGRVYVSDFGEIDVFAPDGRYLDSFSLPGGPAFGLAFNDNDELFVASRTQIYKFTLNEQ